MATLTDPNPATRAGGIGARVTRVDGPAKVTGTAEYPSDVAVKRPLYAYFHTSSIALGRIESMDEQEARALPGVVEIMTWRNTAGMLDTVPPSKGGSTSIPVLQSADIHHDGEIVAVILAEDYETARDASHRLRVGYTSRTPTATFGSTGLGPELQKDGPRFKNSNVGNAAAALQAAAVKVEQHYATPTQHHNAIELFTTTAQWQGDELTIHEPSQFLVGSQNTIAAALRIDPAKVRIISKYVGGAFGAKGMTTSRTGLIALASRKLGRPVKMVATRDQGFTIATYRAETRQLVKLGASRDGKITALIHEGDEVSSRMDSYKVGGTETTARMYSIPNVASKVTVQHADRNTPGFMRAPAEVPYMFALESAMDELAIALQMDPVELRRINDAQIEPIEKRRYSSRSLVQCYDAAAKAFGWDHRRAARPMSMRDGDWQIGWGCATACYPSMIAPSFARVSLSDSGAKVEVAGHEIGTGAYTIYAQTAAQMLGLPVDKVEVIMGDSRLPPAPVAGGSNNAASISNAVAMACMRIREQLAAAAVNDPKSPLHRRDAATVQLMDGQLRAANGTGEPLAAAVARAGGGVEAMVGNNPKNLPPEALAGLRKGRLMMTGGSMAEDFVKYAFGAEFVEVRVHRLTREVRVSRMVGAFAAGTIINPITARSQLMGGMIWGISSALHEATEIDPRNARYTNDNLAEYLIPVNADVPKVDVLFVAETDREVNPLGIKGIGELGCVGTAAAVCNAIFNATGVRIRELPVRIEKLL